MDLEHLVINLLVLVFSVVVHEYAHGLAAFRLGDNTAQLQGRLTLNPMNHVDPIGSIVVPLVLFVTGGMMYGWAKPVPVRVGHLDDPKNDHPKVAAAGPLANLMLAFVSAVGLGIVAVIGELLVKGGIQAAAGHPVLSFFLQLFQTGILLNVMLAIFNLVPVPPLDGSWVLTRFLPYPAKEHYENLRRYGFLPVIGFIILMRSTPVGDVFSGSIRSVYLGFVKITLTIIDWIL